MESLHFLYGAGSATAFFMIVVCVVKWLTKRNARRRDKLALYNSEYSDCEIKSLLQIIYEKGSMVARPHSEYDMVTKEGVTGLTRWKWHTLFPKGSPVSLLTVMVQTRPRERRVEIKADVKAFNYEVGLRELINGQSIL